MSDSMKRWPAAWGAPRLLTREQVRGYLQINDQELVDRIRRAQVPKPLWGTDEALPSARWDREAIDQALTRASAIPTGNRAAQDEMEGFWGHAS